MAEQLVSVDARRRIHELEERVAAADGRLAQLRADKKVLRRHPGVAEVQRSLDNPTRQPGV